MDEHRPPQDNAEWPYSSLLVFGFFGADTPGGKRLVWQTSIALVLIVASSWALTGVIPQVLPAIVWVVAMPAGVGAIAWSYARYLAGLDELSRTIQLKAFAATYGAVMVLAAAIVAILLAVPDEAARVAHPAAYLSLLVLVEPFRGLALVFFARKYR
jgi:hypothetical protein